MFFSAPGSAGSTLNISGNASLSTGWMLVGSLNQGTVNQSGGTVTAGSLDLGWTGTIPNASGYYNLTGTARLIVNGDEGVGWDGYGQITQGVIGDGGLTSNTVAGNLNIATQANINPTGLHAAWRIYTNTRYSHYLQHDRRQPRRRNLHAERWYPHGS